MKAEHRLNIYSYDIQSDAQIPRWWISDILKTPEQSVQSTFTAEINAGESYVQIIYPVREQFIQRCDLQHSTYTVASCPHLHVSYEHDRIDFTDFLHTPHRLSIHARTWILADNDCILPFEVVTCGGIKIWAEQREVLCFTPYTRNIASRTIVQIPCKAGMNEILVHADELAERDVFFYFSLVYKGTKPLSCALELPFEPARLAECERYLESLYFVKDLYIKENLEFAATEPIPTGIHTVTVQSPQILARILGPNDPNQPQDPGNAAWTVAHSKTHDDKVHDSLKIDLSDVRTFDGGAPVYHIPFDNLAYPGFSEYTFSLEIPVTSGGIGNDGQFSSPRTVALQRKLTCAADWQPGFLSSPESAIAGRKNQVLEYLAIHGQNTCTQAIASCAAAGTLTPQARTAFLASLAMVREKQDCSDFHLPALLVCLNRYPELCAEFFSGVKEAALDYRYWIDEPGDDVMWFFSENHALLFHTCQYLAGMLYPDEIFVRSGRTGHGQQVVAKGRLETWFGQFLANGYAEWNSITYIPIDLIGFFALELLAQDPDIRVLAAQSLDKTFEILGAHNHLGVLSSSYGRTYESNLKARHLAETSMMAYITNGQGWMTRTNLATSLYCISSYEPPANARPQVVEPGKEQIVSYVQGALRVELYTARTALHSLGSVRAYRPFVHGHQQHTLNIALQNPLHQLFLNHPGEQCFSGGNRPSYWAGNGTLPLIHQFRSTALVAYRIEETEPVHYIHLYAPLYAMDEVIKDSQSWFFCRMGESYLGIWFSAGYTITSTGANRNKELISQGNVHNVVAVCGDEDEFGCFSRFIELLKASRHVQYGQTWGFVDPRYALLAIDAEGTFTVQGKPFQSNVVASIEPIMLDRQYADPVMAQVERTLERVVTSFKKILYDHDETFMENLGRISADTEQNNRYAHWEWPQGVGLFGLWRLYALTRRTDLLEFLVDYYDARIAHGLPGKNINTISPLLCLTYVYEETQKESYKATCIEWADWMMRDLKRTRCGGFQHITSDSVNQGELWDDTLFMAVLFLARMGKLCDSRPYLDEAMYQFLIHAKYLADPETGLWYHGWTFEGNHHFAKAFWARGNCWITLAIPLLLEMVPESQPSCTRFLSEVLQQQVDSLVQLQENSGLWHTLLDDPASYEESSASAGFGAGIWMGMRSGLIAPKPEHMQCALHALKAVESHIDASGVLHQCSYGTPMGRVSKDFYRKIPLRPMPYGQALAMLLLVEAKIWQQGGED